MPKHRWSIEDDIVALYMYLYGAGDLPAAIGEIGELLGMGADSLLMRIENFRAIDGAGGLSHYAKQSARVYEQFRRVPRGELHSEVVSIIKSS